MLRVATCTEYDLIVFRKIVEWHLRWSLQVDRASILNILVKRIFSHLVVELIRLVCCTFSE